MVAKRSEKNYNYYTNLRRPTMNDVIKIGIFGACRGNNYVELMLQEKDDIEIVAVCDRDENALKNVRGLEKAKLFANFDEFIEEGKKLGMNAVYLANYFHEHAEYAIKAMEAGLNVVSECTAGGTMKDCVELVRCVERTGMKYMLAENYPFMTSNLEVDRVCKSGTLGKILYTEGEYNHSGSLKELVETTPKGHWRAFIPRTYYITHAMGPLMYFTGAMPLYVNAFAAKSTYLAEIKEHRPNSDGTAIITCEMSDGSIMRCTGCTAMVSDYSRYRVVGDLGSVESYGPFAEKVRVLYEDYTKPDDKMGRERLYVPDMSSFGEKGERAAKAGHCGGDFWIVQNMIEYFRHDKAPFFDVYRGVAMSATAILAWKSCLNHGENFKIPDFSKEEERKIWENDVDTPFPDDNGEGATLPPALD